VLLGGSDHVRRFEARDPDVAYAIGPLDVIAAIASVAFRS
jgi:hypothetical protein